MEHAAGDELGLGVAAPGRLEVQAQGAGQVDRPTLAVVVAIRLDLEAPAGGIDLGGPTRQGDGEQQEQQDKGVVPAHGRVSNSRFKPAANPDRAAG